MVPESADPVRAAIGVLKGSGFGLKWTPVSRIVPLDEVLRKAAANVLRVI